MWVKENRKEIEKNRQIRKRESFNPKRPLIASLICFLIFAISKKIGVPSSYTTPYVLNPISWNEFFPRELKNAFYIGLVFFVLSYLWQIISKQRLWSDPPIFFCPQCGKRKYFSREQRCRCGRGFVNLDEMKWVEDKHKQHTDDP